MLFSCSFEPQYRTTYHDEELFFPPETKEGKICLNQCKKERELCKSECSMLIEECRYMREPCIQNCAIENQNCQIRYETIASQRYENYIKYNNNYYRTLCDKNRNRNHNRKKDEKDNEEYIHSDCLDPENMVPKTREAWEEDIYNPPFKCSQSSCNSKCPSCGEHLCRNCTAQYESCYKDCGGEIIRRKVKETKCIAHCD